MQVDTTWGPQMTSVLPDRASNNIDPAWKYRSPRHNILPTSGNDDREVP